MDTAPPVAHAKTSRWEDYVDIYFSPAEVFDRRRTDQWLPPALVLVGIGVVVHYALLPVNQIIAQASVAAQPAAQAMERFGTIIALMGGIMVPVPIAAMIAAQGGLLWLIARVMRVSLPFSRGVLIAVYAAFVMPVQQTVSGGLVLLKPGPPSLPEDLSVGLLRFADAEALAPALVPFLGRLDVFSLWQAALWAVGVAVVGRASRGRAIMVAAVAWLLSAVPTALWALITGTVPASS